MDHLAVVVILRVLRVIDLAPPALDAKETDCAGVERNRESPFIIPQ